MNIKTSHKPLTPWPASKCDQVGTLIKTITLQIYGSHKKKEDEEEEKSRYYEGLALSTQ